MLFAKDLSVPSFNFDCECKAFDVRKHNVELDGGILYKHELVIREDLLTNHDDTHTKIYWNDLASYSNLNSYWLRSDELVKDHKSTHILFSGCSQTFGFGIKNVDDLWSKIIHDAFNNTSGYFNIARNGLSISEVVFDIYQYAKNYGKPDYIFILLPDIKREMVVYKTNLNDLNRTEVQMLRSVQYKLIFNALKMLEYFCKVNNIKLLYSTWDKETSMLLSNADLDNFVNIMKTEDDAYRFYKKRQPDGHWTEEHNKVFADIMLYNLKEDKDENIRY